MVGSVGGTVAKSVGDGSDFSDTASGATFAAVEELGTEVETERGDGGGGPPTEAARGEGSVAIIGRGMAV